jgi:protein TonB
MGQRIRQNWDSQAESASEVVVLFTIQRDGTLSEVKVEKSSGSPPLDLRAQRAIVTTRQLPPLPAAFPNPRLTVHLTFQYTR